MPSPTDSITLSQTHSVRWLAQIVCQIIRAVKWENQFRCEGVSGLADFSAAVAELEALDPVALAVRSSSRSRVGSVPPQLQPSNVIRFAKELDALLNVLDSTADGLAATWDLQQEGMLEGPEFEAGERFQGRRFQ